MHVFIGLTYYRPHYSGLTIYAERLARSLVKRGHRVTVLTSRFDKRLLPYEVCDGVEIIRPNVLFRISKGVIMPSMPLWAWKLAGEADIVNLHLPQLDAALVAAISRMKRKPVVLTYQCDLYLPAGLVHRIANYASNIANHISARLADRIVTTSQDYAENSRFLQSYLHKVRPVLPPVELAPVNQTIIQGFRAKVRIQPGQSIIGMAARLATEKGVEYLVQALPQVLERHPNARVLFVGQHQNVLGEEQYARKLEPLIRELNEHWDFLGLLSPEELSAFYHEADVLVLPSINSTEAFGMVQVEAMSCGTPVVASNLPGVRVPVTMTGMGRIVAPRDSASLAEAIVAILDDKEKYLTNPREIAQHFSPERMAAEYEALFEELISTYA
jgi:glycosyltransferase involved in cell wall biosynthesis